jgi:hypothetical protein
VRRVGVREPLAVQRPALNLTVVIGVAEELAPHPLASVEQAWVSVAVRRVQPLAVLDDRAEPPGLRRLERDVDGRSVLGITELVDGQLDRIVARPVTQVVLPAVVVAGLVGGDARHEHVIGIRCRGAQLAPKPQQGWRALNCH